MNHMKDTLVEHKGVGIAAVQIGKTKRAFIMWDQEHKNFIPIINPIILFVEGEQDSKEMCLSCPGVEATIVRPKTIGVQFLDLDRHMHTMKFEGKLACIFGHEYDHLEGITIADLAGVH